MIRKLINIYRKQKHRELEKQAKLKREQTEKNYLSGGQIPWSPGYWEYKLKLINQYINNPEIINAFAQDAPPENYGYRIDERIVEYPWIFSRLPKSKVKMLDAGSTFNYDYIVEHPLIKEKDLIIYTYAPEEENFLNKRISYVFGDLRELPFKEDYFDVIVSQSTIEHIDMDNSMYGYNINHNKNENTKSYEYMLAVNEMLRVLKRNGMLLITFPYGKFEHHGFFQQLDSEMVGKITASMGKVGDYSTTFFRYTDNAWRRSTQVECDNEESFNPHTGRGKKEDFAAHSRAICCIQFTKK